MTEDWVRAIDPPSKKYEWSIEDVNAFKNAPVGKQFLSNEFKMYGATWSLSCSPNGQDDEGKGSVALFLRCEDFGPFLKACAVKCNLIIKELNITKLFSDQFTEIGLGWGFARFCASHLLKDQQTLTIQCTIDFTGPADCPLYQYHHKLQQLPQLQAKLQDTDHELEVLRNECDRLTSEGMAKDQQTVSLKVKLKKEQDNSNRVKNELEILRNECDRVTSEGILKDQEIVSLKDKLSSAYTLSEVHHPNSGKKETMDMNAVKEKVKKSEDGAFYQKHAIILSEWNILTEKLEKLAKPLKERDDDEKQPAEQDETALSADKLLRKYGESHSLIHQQQRRLSRMENVFMSDLISHQNGLSVKYSICFQSTATH